MVTTETKLGIPCAKDLDRSSSDVFHFGRFVIDVFQQESFKTNRECLLATLKVLYPEIFIRETEETNDIVETNLKPDNVMVALTREKGDLSGRYKGFLSGCKYVLSVGEGESEAKLNVGYISNRALQPDLREQGVGTFLYELFPFVYKCGKGLDMVFHRLGNPAAAYTAIKSAVFKHGYYPFGDGKTMRLYKESPIVRDAAYALYPQITRYSTAYYRNLGLSVGEYKRPGKDFKLVYEEHLEHKPTIRILNMMKSLGAKLKNGDAFICGGPRKPIAVILAENPQLSKFPSYGELPEIA